MDYLEQVRMKAARRHAWDTGNKAWMRQWLEDQARRSTTIPAEFKSDYAAQCRKMLGLYGGAVGKANFNPAQPRDDLGRWTDDGGGQETSEPGEFSENRSDWVRLAGDISGFTKHGINQAINRGVGPAAMLDAVSNPIKILPQANGTTRYIGSGAVVVIDPRGQVITTWRR